MLPASPTHPDTDTLTLHASPRPRFGDALGRPGDTPPGLGAPVSPPRIFFPKWTPQNEGGRPPDLRDVSSWEVKFGGARAPFWGCF